MQRMNLSKYFRSYRFPGRPAAGPYSVRSIQRFRAAATRAQPRRRYYPAARIQRAMGMPSRVEVKSFDVTPANADVPLPGGAVGAEPAAFAGLCELNCVQAGNAFYQRIGTKINVKSVMCRFQFVNSIVTATGAFSELPAVLRYMVVYDRQTNAAFPAMTDILQNNDTGAVTLGSSVNITNRDRFVVLRDKQVELDYANQQSCWITEYIKCPSLDVQFKSSTDTIGDITTGAIYLMVFGVYQHGPSMTSAQIQNIQARVRYFDI